MPASPTPFFCPQARESQDAARITAITQANNLAADAASLVPADPGLTAQFAVAAYRTSLTPLASSQLYASLQTSLDRRLSATGSGVLRVAAQSHGPLAAAVDADGSRRRGRIRTRELILAWLKRHALTEKDTHRSAGIVRFDHGSYAMNPLWRT